PARRGGAAAIDRTDPVDALEPAENAEEQRERKLGGANGEPARLWGLWRPRRAQSPPHDEIDPGPFEQQGNATVDRDEQRRDRAHAAPGGALDERQVTVLAHTERIPGKAGQQRPAQ